MVERFALIGAWRVREGRGKRESWGRLEFDVDAIVVALELFGDGAIDVRQRTVGAQAPVEDQLAAGDDFEQTCAQGGSVVGGFRRNEQVVPAEPHSR
jgi:hypothetical protein